MKTREMALAEARVSGLIDLVAAGVDPDELVSAVHEEIFEGSGGGPYPIGSRVKINTAWSGKTIEGMDVSLARADVVSVLQPNLGEHGQDKMVLLSDGKTRVVVPYAILGEAIDEQGNGLDKGPKGHEVQPAKGPLGGTIPGKAQGEAPTPEQSQPPKAIGSKQPMALTPSTFQGSGKPKDAPTAQVPGAMAAVTVSGKTIEQIEGEVLQALEEIMADSRDRDNDAAYRQASELQRALLGEDDQIIYAVLHQAIFGEDQYTVESLNEIASLLKEKKNGNGNDDDENGNKKKNPFLKATGGGKTEQENNGKKKPPFVKGKKNGNGDAPAAPSEAEEGYTEQDLDEVFCAMSQMKKRSRLY